MKIHTGKEYPPRPVTEPDVPECAKCGLRLNPEEYRIDVTTMLDAERRYVHAFGCKTGRHVTLEGI